MLTGEALIPSEAKGGEHVRRQIEELLKPIDDL
jgi:hypothetical protein